MEITHRWSRILGLIGVLGGLLLLTGDLLFYYRGDSIDLLSNMGNVADFRIEISGMLALLASWCYLLGVGHIAFGLGSAGIRYRYIILICFAFIFVAYGVVHGAYVAIATSAQLSVEYNMDMDVATALAASVNDDIRLLIYPVAILLTWTFVRSVWLGHTRYPRWIICFFPMVLLPFQFLFSAILSGGLWAIVVGGYYNLMFVVFFVASSLSLWRQGRKN